MSSASAAVGLRFRHLAERVLRPADALPEDFPPLPNAAARIAATAMLLAMIAGAALILALTPFTTTTAVPTVDVTDSRVPAGPVRIVGATPRSDNCSEQVWPYIERRCLARAERPKAGAATVDAPGVRATSGAAPAEPAAPTAAAARSRVATANLALPRQRFAPADSDRAAARVWQDIETGSDAAEGIVPGEPRRRTPRRAHRHRPRSFFLFPF